jgi:hypothetical protein
VFPVYGFRLTIFWPLAKTSRREVLLIMVRSPVITTLTKEEILDNHRSVLCSFGISTSDEELDLPSLYWIYAIFVMKERQVLSNIWVFKD